MDKSGQADVSGLHGDKPKHEYCASISQAMGENPIGTAGGQHHYLLVEVPLPWTDNITESSKFPNGMNDVLKKCMAQGLQFRFLAIWSEFNSPPPGYTRVIEYRQPAGEMVPYVKREYLLPTEQVADLAEALLASGSVDQYHTWQQPDQGIRDILVCTHGTHDLCCGKFGYPIYRELGEAFASSPDTKLRAWRVSHIGGHRFAPTLIDFPEGRFWAHVTSEVLGAIVRREGATVDIIRHYRGVSGIGAFGQVAERELFASKGWSWLQYAKTMVIQSQSDTGAVVQITYRSPDGSDYGTSEFEVYVEGTVKTGGCGHDGEVKQLAVR
ncbi:sucrase ferredoxin [Paenibacillus roseus]|uniref:Sucrase ferredoxin n=1 Tax=Paenibacillus roseus TaxID=2798579 RepID=A0A934MN32_9BACL|nr:hypothetical protein [Paenibacillus roseus]